MNLLKVKKYSSQFNINIIVSFGFKVLFVLINFITIPFAIKEIGDFNYGVWISSTSIMSWFFAFDLGIYNNLKNILSECFVKKELKNEITENIIIGHVKIAIILSLFVFLILSAFIFLNIIKLNHIDKNFGSVTLLAISFLSCMKFVFSLSNSIYSATGRHYVIDILQFISSTLFLFSLFMFGKKLEIYEFIILTSALQLTPFAVSFFLAFFELVSINSIKKKKKQNLKKYISGTNLNFLYIQLGALIIFSTDSIIIENLLGGKQVAIYNTSYKIFTLPIMLFGIILGPTWSIFTQMWVKKEKEKILKHINKVLLMFYFLCMLLVFMVIFDDVIYIKLLKIPKIIDNNLNRLMAIYSALYMFSSVFLYFQNAISDLKIQVKLTTIIILTNIPLTYILIYFFDFSSKAVVISNILSLSLYCFFVPLDVYKLIKNK